MCNFVIYIDFKNQILMIFVKPHMNYWVAFHPAGVWIIAGVKQNIVNYTFNFFIQNKIICILILKRQTIPSKSKL